MRAASGSGRDSRARCERWVLLGMEGVSFSADGPDEAWFADITYVRTHQGWLYLAVVMDIWSRRIVGWSMSARMTAELADDALKCIR